ncbi:hypothetical protein ACHGLA_17095 [Streptomyces sp. YH02]|uniref:hypothetical protein n=1 Tax=Streptomyces sp. YH02 TaxID=3256999 RepID=UPI00375824C3
MEIFLFIVLGFLVVAGVLIAVWSDAGKGTSKSRSRGRRADTSSGSITWADGGSGSSCGGGSSSCGGSSSSCGGGGGGGGGCGGGS